ncbi:MAG: serine/threonine protein kinase [Kordiimonadaceae bacterium]|nr:serine/threonine protein kinase [Kordiimonadaceae bacterium]
MTLYHASCVELGGKGILIEGPSGSGKSDLSLRLIDAGAKLVSDDYVDIRNENGTLVGYGPPNIEGMLEIRGIGLLKTDYIKSSPLYLTLELTPRDEIERLPEADFFEMDDVRIPYYKFDAFSVSAIAKITMLLNTIADK